MAEELTRKELLAQLEAAQAENAALRSGQVKAPAEVDPKMARELEAAKRELASLKAAAPAAAPVGSPQHVPYRGKAQATEDCHIGGAYRMGPLNPNGNGQGDIFDIDVPVLWTDDPYRPVILTGETAPGVFTVEPHPTARRVDFRFRYQVRVSTDLEPLRASAF